MTKTSPSTCVPPPLPVGLLSLCVAAPPQSSVLSPQSLCETECGDVGQVEGNLCWHSCKLATIAIEVKGTN